eukprot:7086921-Heterocapsa_arctica.AAC.1
MAPGGGFLVLVDDVVDGPGGACPDLSHEAMLRRRTKTREAVLPQEAGKGARSKNVMASRSSGRGAGDGAGSNVPCPGVKPTRT